MYSPLKAVRIHVSRWPCTCLDFNQVAGVHAKNYIPPLNDYDAASALHSVLEVRVTTRTRM